MAMKAKHAFGSSKNLSSALSSGAIDSFDILFLDGDTENPKIGWVDKNGNPVILREEDEVVIVDGDSLPESGESGKIYVCGSDAYVWNNNEFVNLCKPTDVSALENDVSALEAEIVTKVTAEEVNAMIKESMDSSVEIVEF